MVQVIATGSSGNSIIYHNCILVDCGVPFSLIAPHIKSIQIVLLTHSHGDHINVSTLRRMQSERPALRIGCCEWMIDKVQDLRNVDTYSIGEIFDYGIFKLSPVKLYHDVPNCGYRIFKDNTKIFHATDTSHLDGITAKDYDLYAIEHNYNEDTIHDMIAAKRARGEFSHQMGSFNSHLSEQQARDFIFKNGNEQSKVIRLHESRSA